MDININDLNENSHDVKASENFKEFLDALPQESQDLFGTTGILKLKAQAMRNGDYNAIDDENFIIKFPWEKDIPEDPQKPKSLTYLERVINQRNEIINVEFLEQGLLKKQPVVKVRTQAAGGTGIILKNGILLTAAHNLKNNDEVESANIFYNYESNIYGESLTSYQFQLNPDRFWFVDSDKDILCVALEENSKNEKSLSYEDLDYVSLDNASTITAFDPANIIHHPDGNVKKLTVHNSHFLERLEGSHQKDMLHCWYNGDTLPGSSGAPVFNNSWDMIAMHVSSVADTDEDGFILDKNGARLQVQNKQISSLSDLEYSALMQVKWIANQGILSSEIIKALYDAKFNNQMTKLRDDLIG